ncbi:helix-turn-helix transcriptional regulator [Mesorhizobium camelthorni]|uniref:Helix-turn-helix transcriptional regulator n=1 Tax=Allomesorhizobium camelthorni TaxID=475069 RepID=A0A6G4WD81_9HYPH|nr:helix-turn-helix transcriptional regulator [Mesorhizobium camelthorni]
MDQTTGSLDTLNYEPDRRSAHPKILDVIPESAGPRIATARGGAIHCVRGPGSQAVLAESHFAAVMLAPAPGNRAALGSDRMLEYDAPVGALVIHPANVEGRAVWSSTRESVIIAIRPESMAELAASELDAGHVAIQPPAFGTVDPQALYLAQLLKAELTQRETPNELYVDSLVTMFGVHILRNYTGVQQLPPAPKGGLSNRSARRVQEFLEVNFSSKISVADLAAVSGLSPRHFIQAFTRTFGEPPHKHLLRLRLSFAERLLVKGEMPIAEVAHLSGFSSQSHLTTAMMKYRRITPMQVRRKG